MRTACGEYSCQGRRQDGRCVDVQGFQGVKGWGTEARCEEGVLNVDAGVASVLGCSKWSCGKVRCLGSSRRMCDSFLLGLGFSGYGDLVERGVFEKGGGCIEESEDAMDAF